MTTCVLCGDPHNRDPRAKYCWTCRARIIKSQQVVVHIIQAAIKRGDLPKLTGDISCTDCGKPAIEYDHRDYNKPLDVEPVCRKCNFRRGPAVPMVAA